MKAMRKGATSGVCLGLVALFGSETAREGMPGSYRRPTSTTSRPQALKTILQLQRNTNRAKNVILFVGDGMRVWGPTPILPAWGGPGLRGTTRKVVDPGCTGEHLQADHPCGRTKEVRGLFETARATTRSPVRGRGPIILPGEEY